MIFLFQCIEGSTTYSNWSNCFCIAFWPRIAAKPYRKQREPNVSRRSKTYVAYTLTVAPCYLPIVWIYVTVRARDAWAL